MVRCYMVTFFSSAGKDICWKDINLNKFVRIIFWEINRWKILFLIFPTILYGIRILFFSLQSVTVFYISEVEISPWSRMKERKEWKKSWKIKSYCVFNLTRVIVKSRGIYIRWGSRYSCLIEVEMWQDARNSHFLQNVEAEETPFYSPVM